MEANEEYVRQRWEREWIVCDGSYRHYAKGTVLLNWANHCFYEFADFQAAYDFTIAREEQIRLVEEEIKAIEELIICTEPGDWIEGTEPPVYECTQLPESWKPRLQRILAREQAALDELRKGFKR